MVLCQRPPLRLAGWDQATLQGAYLGREDADGMVSDWFVSFFLEWSHMDLVFRPSNTRPLDQKHNSGTVTVID